MKSAEFYKTTAWKHFSRYILLKHSKKGIAKCCTCGRFLEINNRKCHAGHFVKVFDANSTNFSTAFDEENVLPQCYQCNKYKGGDQFKMAFKLQELFGEDVIERLRIKSNQMFKLDKFTLELLAKEYKHKYDKLVETKGKYW